MGLHLEMKLKYAGLPVIKAKSMAEEAYARMLRALFLQNNRKVNELYDLLNEIDFAALEDLASSSHYSSEEILFAYLSAMGFKKEYTVITSEYSSEIIRLLK